MFGIFLPSPLVVSTSSLLGWNLHTKNVASDVFGLLRVTGGTPSGPRWRQALASGRGRERGTEDREKGVGSKIFPAQPITQGRGRGQEYSCLNYLPPSYPSPPPPIHLPRARGERRGVSQQLTHGPEERGRGGATSQLAHLTRRWGERLEGEGWPAR